MRRMGVILLTLMLCAGVAQATEQTPAADLMQATDAIYAAVQARMPGAVAEDMRFLTVEHWMSAVFQFAGQDTTQWVGVIYDTADGALVTWEDLFLDGDAAAAGMEAIAREATYDNAYAERLEIAPMPRDNFAIQEGELFVYYPPEQFSYFSGRAGAFAFYAFELQGLLREEVPLRQGDAALAGDLRMTALADGALPGNLSAWAVGQPIQAAADALGLVDVPDIKEAFAVWRFEAPEMRGAALLSAQDDDRVATARTVGVYTERIDFGGLQTGISTRADCVAALGEPETAVQVSGENAAYALYPQGERLRWSNGQHALLLHFVEGVLHSVTVCAADVL